MSSMFSRQKKVQYPIISYFKKSWLFLKESFLVSFIFSTILYILMRVFFIGADFSMAESTELYVKTFFITCFYINAWRMICLAIIWIEKRSARMSFKGVFNMQLMKRAAILILAAGLAYKVKANPLKKIHACHKISIQKVKEQELIPQFYLWMK